MTLLTAADETIIVASFRGAVRAVTETLSVSHPGKFEFVHLGSFGKQSSSGDNPYMPINDALSMLVEVLYRNLGRATRLSALRDLLAHRDERFQKVQGRPTARPGYIYELAHRAKTDGLVEMRPNFPGDNNPNVVLTDKGISLGIPGIQAMRRGSSLDKERSTSDQYIDILRGANLGPFQEVRWAIYNEIERILVSEPITFSALFRSSVAAVRETSATRLVRGDKPFPWAKARTFIETLASRTAAFTHDGSPVQYSWTRIDLPVDGTVKNWRLALDGELVCYLLSQNATISFNDVPALAGSLYNSRSEEAQERVIAVISHVLAAGKVATFPSDQTRLCLATENPCLKARQVGESPQ
jgi:hypothetical protein